MEQADPKKVKATIMQLSEIADLIGLRTHVIEKTHKGRNLGHEPWQYTREYMQSYAEPANTQHAIEMLRSAGCNNDIEAVRWLLKHDELVP